MSSPPLVAPSAQTPPPRADWLSCDSVPPSPRCSPASLDAFVFSYLALLLQVKLPGGKLQAHLQGLQNLCAYCTHILSLYFPWDGGKGRRPWGQRAGTRDLAPRPLSFLSCQLRCHLHARHERARRRKRSRTGAGTRSCLCWRGWRPWWATPCSAASSLSSGRHLPGPQTRGPWGWPKRTKRSDRPRAPRTDFSTVMHSRGSCVSPWSVRPEMGLSSQNKPVTLTGVRRSLRGHCFPRLVPRAVGVPEPSPDARPRGRWCPDADTAHARAQACTPRKDKQSSVLGRLPVSSSSHPHLCLHSELTLGLRPVSTGNQHRAHAHAGLGWGAFPKGPPAPGTSRRGE